MKKILLPIIFLILLVPHLVFGAEINCTTLVANGSTNNYSALNTCLAAASGEVEKICNIPSSGASHYYWAGQVTVPEGVSVIGAANWASDMRGQFLLLNDDAKIIGLEFIAGIGARPIAINNQDSPTVSGMHVRDCKFTGVNHSTSVITAWNADNCIIDNNVITNANSDGDNIEFQAGDNNIIVNNTINSGETGVIFKYDWRNNNKDEGYKHNIIMNNAVSNVSEEFISFDLSLNSAGGVPHRESDSVAAINGNVITLSDSGWGGGDDPDYVGLYMSVVKDVDAQEKVNGQYRVITGQNDAAFTLASAITGLEVGDWISIGALAVENYIAFNTCSGSGFPRSCPILYGNSFHNRVEENSSNGMRVNHVDNHHVSDTSVTGNCGRGPSGYNLFRANVITTTNGGTCTDTWSKCLLQAYLRDFAPSPCNQFPDNDYRAYGNVAVDNTVGNTLTWTDQWDYYLNNNTYDSIVLDRSTDAGSTELDVTSWTCQEYGMSCVGAGSTIARVVALDNTCPGATVCAGYGAGEGPPPQDADIGGLIIE